MKWSYLNTLNEKIEIIYWFIMCLGSCAKHPLLTLKVCTVYDIQNIIRLGPFWDKQTKYVWT